MDKKAVFIVAILVLLTLVSAGCLDLIDEIDNSVTYESHPTSILYTIEYGYLIRCSGSGEYEIKYDCDEPEVLSGTVLSKEVHDSSYTLKTLATYNKIYSWNIDSKITKDYDLGITASVSSNSYMVPDLNGNKALSVQEIKDEKPVIFAQYTKPQSNDTTVFIDPNNSDIQEISSEIYNNASSDNSFIVAKELFKWLKDNTNYKTHLISNYVQPTSETLDCKTGDCDDLSFLYISLCRAVGIPSRFIRGFLVDEVTLIPHAWVEVFVGEELGNDGWIPVECAGTSGSIETEINQNFGIESAEHLRLFTDDGSNESLIISLSGLSYVTYGNRNIDAEAYTAIESYSIAKSNKLKIDENGIRSYI